MSSFLLSTPASRADRERWIRAKYVQRAFAERSTVTAEETNMRFWNAADEGEVFVCLQSLVDGAAVDYHNASAYGQTALLNVIAKCDYRMLQFLQYWNADFTALDNRGRGALHYAVNARDQRLVALLLKRHLACDVKDVEGEVGGECERVLVVCAALNVLL